MFTSSTFIYLYSFQKVFLLLPEKHFLDLLLLNYKINVLVMAMECGFSLWEGVRKQLLPGDRYKWQVFVCPPLYVRAEISKNMHSSHRCDNSLVCQC